MLSCILVLSPGAVYGDAQGVYERVELRKRERALLKTATEYEERFIRLGYRYQKEQLEVFLVRIGEQLQPESTDPYMRYRFFLLRDPSANAFALPDGQIYVHTGMLALLENEAQLAALLAHEINHVAGHHGILSYRSARKKVIASMVLGPLTLGLSDLFLILAMLGYSRDLEEEADRRGVERLLDAGYDVREMPQLFTLLHRDPEGVQPPQSTKWSTHPQLLDRADYLRGMISELPTNVELDTLRVGRDSYQALTRSAALMTVHDHIRADYPRTAVDLARRLIAEDSLDPWGHIALGDALRALGPFQEIAPDIVLTKRQKKKAVRKRARLTRREREAKQLESEEGSATLQRNMREAREAYRQAMAMDQGLAEIYRGLGHASRGLGLSQEAARAFMKYLKMRPDAFDKPQILEELQEISRALRRERGGTADAEESQR